MERGVAPRREPPRPQARLLHLLHSTASSDRPSTTNLLQHSCSHLRRSSGQARRIRGVAASAKVREVSRLVCRNLESSAFCRSEAYRTLALSLGSDPDPTRALRVTTRAASPPLTLMSATSRSSATASKQTCACRATQPQSARRRCESPLATPRPLPLFGHPRHLLQPLGQLTPRRRTRPINQPPHRPNPSEPAPISAAAASPFDARCSYPTTTRLHHSPHPDSPPVPDQWPNSNGQLSPAPSPVRGAQPSAQCLRILHRGRPDRCPQSSYT